MAELPGGHRGQAASSDRAPRGLGASKDPVPRSVRAADRVEAREHSDLGSDPPLGIHRDSSSGRPRKRERLSPPSSPRVPRPWRYSPRERAARSRGRGQWRKARGQLARHRGRNGRVSSWRRCAPGARSGPRTSWPWPRSESPTTDPDSQRPVQELLGQSLAEVGLRVRRLRGRASGGTLIGVPRRRPSPGLSASPRPHGHGLALGDAREDAGRAGGPGPSRARRLRHEVRAHERHHRASRPQGSGGSSRRLPRSSSSTPTRRRGAWSPRGTSLVLGAGPHGSSCLEPAPRVQGEAQDFEKGDGSLPRRCRGPERPRRVSTRPGVRARFKNSRVWFGVSTA